MPSWPHRYAAEHRDSWFDAGRWMKSSWVVALVHASEQGLEGLQWLDLAAAGARDASLAQFAAYCRDEIASHLTPADLAREQETGAEVVIHQTTTHTIVILGFDTDSTIALQRRKINSPRRD
jgi:hypothetical protein